MTSRPVMGAIPIGLPPPSLLLGSMPMMAGMNQSRGASMMRVTTAPSTIQVRSAHPTIRVAPAPPAMHPQRATLQATSTIPQRAAMQAVPTMHPQRAALQATTSIHPQRLTLQTSTKPQRGFARSMLPAKPKPVVTLPMPVSMMDYDISKMMVPPTATKKRRCRPKQMLAAREVCLRSSAGATWVDKNMDEWPTDDFRIFVGDLGNEVSDATLTAAFAKYSSFKRARVVRDKRNGKSKGYGFVSLMDASEYLLAMKEMDRKYVGSRPIKLKRSKWKDRQSKSFTNPLKVDKRRKAKRGRGTLKHLAGFDKSERKVDPI